MWIKQTFGLINETGVVENDIVCDNYEVANQIARLNYGNGAIAVDSTQHAITKGDSYIDGVFFRNEVELARIPTETENIAILTTENNALKERLTLSENVINDIILNGQEERI